MSLAHMEQLPAVHSRYLRKEAAAMPLDTRILTLCGINIFLWLVTLCFLVMTTTWVLINLRDCTIQKAPGINLKDL
jgi:hypothetical protein